MRQGAPRIYWHKLGEALNAQATARGLNLAAVAEAAGVTKRCVYSAANGVAISPVAFMALCHWLDADPRDFFEPEAPIHGTSQDS